VLIDADAMRLHGQFEKNYFDEWGVGEAQTPLDPHSLPLNHVYKQDRLLSSLQSARATILSGISARACVRYYVVPGGWLLRSVHLRKKEWLDPDHTILRREKDLRRYSCFSFVVRRVSALPVPQNRLHVGCSLHAPSTAHWHRT
jgi:hypothetical protein